MHRIYLAFLCFFRVLFGKPLPDEVFPPMPMPPALPEARPAPDPMHTKKTLPVEGGPISPLAVPQTAVAPPKSESAKEGALQLLALLQREGRLVDFLRESIEQYDDATIGAAVRDIHRGCKKAIEDHFTLEPVMAGTENERVTVAAGFDPGRIRLVGEIKGQPPFAGTLRHHGWTVVKVKLPQTTGAVDHAVVAPAEVEVA